MKQSHEVKKNISQIFNASLYITDRIKDLYYKLYLVFTRMLNSYDQSDCSVVIVLSHFLTYHSFSSLYHVTHDHCMTNIFDNRCSIF